MSPRIGLLSPRVVLEYLTERLYPARISAAVATIAALLAAFAIITELSSYSIGAFFRANINVFVGIIAAALYVCVGAVLFDYLKFMRRKSSVDRARNVSDKEALFFPWARNIIVDSNSQVTLNANAHLKTHLMTGTFKSKSIRIIVLSDAEFEPTGGILIGSDNEAVELHPADRKKSGARTRRTKGERKES